MLQVNVAKRLESPEESHSEIKEYHSESSKADETRNKIGQPENYFAAFDSLKNTVLKYKQKYPLLPASYGNTYAPDDDGNRTILFDDIGQAQLLYFIPPGLRRYVTIYATCSSGSKEYGFVTFREHQMARRFLREFNGSVIPGTDITYNLSWAPFGRDNYRDDFGRDNDSDDDLEEQATEVNDSDDDLEDSDDDLEDSDDEVAEDDTVTKIGKAFKKFFDNQHEKAHKENRAFWKWPTSEEKYYPDEDDGLTTLLLLFNVHPAIKEVQLGDLFDCFGKCTVKLFDNGGFGIVKFVTRESAADAYDKVSTMLMTAQGIFSCTWGFEFEHPFGLGSCFSIEEVASGLYVKIRCHYECIFLGKDCPFKEEILKVETAAAE